MDAIDSKTKQLRKTIWNDGSLDAISYESQLYLIGKLDIISYSLKIYCKIYVEIDEWAIYKR